MPKRPTVKAEWESFARAVMPPDAPDVQRQEMRRAFYAGAFSILMIYFQIGDDSVTEAEGVSILEGLTRECRDFNAKVASGRA